MNLKMWCGTWVSLRIWETQLKQFLDICALFRPRLEGGTSQKPFKGLNISHDLMLKFPLKEIAISQVDSLFIPS